MDVILSVEEIQRVTLISDIEAIAGVEQHHDPV